MNSKFVQTIYRTPMKKAFLALILLCGINSIAQNTKLSGTIQNPQQDYVYLQYYNKTEQGWELVIVDSAKVDAGKFSMNFQIDSLTTLTFNDGNEFKELYLMPGDDMHIRLNTKFFDESFQCSGKGCERNNMMSSVYLAQESTFNNVYVNTADQSNIDTTELWKKLKEWEEDLISFVNDQKEEFKEMAGELDETAKGLAQRFARYPKQIRQDIAFAKMELAVIGKDFVNVEGVDLEGKKIDMKSFYGKPVLLDFWATWCGPCKYEMPFLQEMEKEIRADVNVVSVGVWCKEEDWKKMAEEFGFEFNIFLERDVADVLKEEYMLYYIPRYMLLDKDGKIVDISAERPSGSLKGQIDSYLQEN